MKKNIDIFQVEENMFNILSERYSKYHHGYYEVRNIKKGDDFILDEEKYMAEEEYLERWEYDFYRKFKNLCPGVFIDENDEFKFIENWSNSIHSLFSTEMVWLEDKADMYYNVEFLDQMFETELETDFHVLNVFLDENMEDYTEEEWDKVQDYRYSIIEELGSMNKMFDVVREESLDLSPFNTEDIDNYGYMVMDLEDMDYFLSTSCCSWCSEEFEKIDLIETQIGELCWNCKKAIESKGENINL